MPTDSVGCSVLRGRRVRGLGFFVPDSSVLIDLLRDFFTCTFTFNTSVGGKVCRVRRVRRPLAIDGALDCDRDLALALAADCDRDLPLALAADCERDLALALATDSDRDLALALAADCDRDLALALALVLALGPALALALALAVFSWTCWRRDLVIGLRGARPRRLGAPDADGVAA